MTLSGLIGLTKFEVPLQKDKQYVFASNHFSYLDILSLNVQSGHFFRFMAKSELGNIPLFKIFFGTIDIPVDRKSMRGSIMAFKEAQESLKNGHSLGIFPEGGIGEKVPKLSRFKSGAFKLAIESGVPVVPIAILDNWKRLPGGGLESGGTPGLMRMMVHKPIETAHMGPDDVNTLSKKVFDIIQKSIDDSTFEF